MNYQIFAWDRSKNKLRRQERWIEVGCTAGLFLCAAVLLGVNLGTLPLLDYPEAMVGQVAKQIWQTPADAFRWLIPNLAGEAYFDRLALGHRLIALFYAFGGANEWTTRLPGALLTAGSVPLLYSLGREMFPVRTPALLSAWVYLTFLPVIRHGRLANFDGIVLCFALATLLAVLRSRRDLRWSLGVGLGFGLLCLIQGKMAILLVAIAFAFLFWDTPRLLSSVYFWLGMALGSLPAIVGYSSLWLYSSPSFTERLSEFIGAIGGTLPTSGYFWLEMLVFSLPWLIFSFHGVRLAWKNPYWSWAKLVLIWTGVYLAVFVLGLTDLSESTILIYPALALAAGAIITEALNLPSYRSYPRIWTVLLSLLALSTAIVCVGLYFGVTFDFIEKPSNYLLVILAAFIATLSSSAFLIAKRDRQFIAVLFWGMYVCLFLFFASPHWLWELKNAYPVKPVAEILAKVTPADKIIYTSFEYDRPSLNFYSDRRVLTATTEQIVQHWQTNSAPYLLIDKRTLNNLNLEKAQILEEAPPNWVVLTKK